MQTVSEPLTHAARYMPGVDQRLAEERARRAAQALAFVIAYNNGLDEAAIPPNGDDYNELVEGVAIILAGGAAPRVVITHAGR